MNLISPTTESFLRVTAHVKAKIHTVIIITLASIFSHMLMDGLLILQLKDLGNKAPFLLEINLACIGIPTCDPLT